MPALVDASSPIRFTGTPVNGGTIVSANFTPPADSLLVCIIEGDGDSVNTGTTTRTPSTATLTWAKQVERNATEATDGGSSEIWTAIQTSSALRAVTVTEAHSNSTAVGFRVSARVYVVTGADITGTPVDAVTASNEGGTGTTPLTTTALTPGATGLIFAAITDWSIKGVITSSDLTLDHAEYAGAIDVADGYHTVTSGVSTSATFTAGAAGPQFKWCQIIVRQAAATGRVPYQPLYQTAPVMAQ